MCHLVNIYSLTLLHISGVVDGAYVSRETPMLMYLNLHAALDQMREKAKKNPSLTGPRVCISLDPVV